MAILTFALRPVVDAEEYRVGDIVDQVIDGVRDAVTRANNRFPFAGDIVGQANVWSEIVPVPLIERIGNKVEFGVPKQ